MRDPSSAFQIQSLLGSGGHGEVYRAECAETGEPVALKVLRAALAARPSFVEALRRECQILSALSHPNIVQVSGLAEVRGRPALVMELLDGADLRAQRKTPLSPAVACEIMAQLLGALAYLHDRGILHRDIKPANVFWTGDGRIVLTDFGIAQAEDGTATTGRLKGSLGYMAPERFRGLALPASDLYAVGLLGWELLTGAPACPPGELAERMRWHLHVGPPDPRSRAPDVPSELCALLAALTAPRLHERPEDGAAALALMGRLGLCDPPTQPSPSPSQRPQLRPRPPPVLPALPLAWILGSATLLALLGVATLLRVPVEVWVGAGAAAAAVWLQGERGGAAWASLWLLCAIGCVVPLVDTDPYSWVGAALAGLLSWGLSAAARSERLPLSLLELLINLAGLGALCTLFWHGIFSLVG